METLLKKTGVSLALPQKFARMEDSVTKLIDGFTHSMQELKTKHRQHMDKFLKKHYSGSRLRQMLAKRSTG